MNETGNETQTVTVVKPVWAQGRYIDEQGFLRHFLLSYPMAYMDGAFFTHKGRKSEEEVKKMIYDFLYNYFSTGLASKAAGLLEVLKLECTGKPLLVRPFHIRCPNGLYSITDCALEQTRDFYRYRIPVNYNPNAPEPVRWKAFLNDLLIPEDILTLQEFMGYCLMPTNMAQKMLLMVGSGGEGKSRIGIVMQYLLGQCMCNGSLAKLEASPFARADLQHRLVMVDDDLRLEGLNNTNYIKSIITAEQPLDLEKKGQQSYQGLLHCRLMAFGNGTLKSLHDRSHGFFRRQIILTVKDRAPDREDDPFLIYALKEELEGILLWCIEGAERLICQNMRFTISARTKENLRLAVAEGNNVVDFLQSEGYIRFDRESQITSRLLYNLYRDWCDDNMVTALSAKSFTAWLTQNAAAYGLIYSNHIPGGNGRQVRGFRGLRAASRI